MKQKINIKNIELKLLKSSLIEDGDIILVKVDNNKSLSIEETREIYTQITSMLDKKDLKIFAFPKNLDISLIKNFIENNGINNLENYE